MEIGFNSTLMFKLHMHCAEFNAIHMLVLEQSKKRGRVCFKYLSSTQRSAMRFLDASCRLAL